MLLKKSPLADLGRRVHGFTVEKHPILPWGWGWANLLTHGAESGETPGGNPSDFGGDVLHGWAGRRGDAGAAFLSVGTVFIVRRGRAILCKAGLPMAATGISGLRLGVRLAVWVSYPMRTCGE
jgi:hypothetical protein